MPEDKLKFLGDRIRSARKDCGLTQQALADQADLAVEFAVLSCVALLACCFIGRAFFRNKKERTCSENAASARINLIVRIFIVALLLCIGFFRRKLFDALLKQGAYSFFYCAAWFLALIPTTVLNAADILRPMCRRQKAEEQLP